LAFQDQDNWSVIVVNNNVPGSAPTRLRIALPTSSALRSTGAFETGANEDLAPVQRPRSMNGAGAEVQVPSQSVTTYTFTRNLQKG
jgi:hypothetical protein